ncbi:hypothetical protein ACFQVD_26890 [Streptosporangium amethystogenes subsp. fukuiense]|uniref:Uncharacterized protein n=1 Tax=Streptosporangium amethystogenes subsp. fukuiense TaxID=698418 RepID=A0ABW2T672_9ACTN
MPCLAGRGPEVWVSVGPGRERVSVALAAAVVLIALLILLGLLSLLL